MADDVVLGEGVAGCTMSAVTIFNFEQIGDKWKTINIFIHIFKILCVCLSVCGYVQMCVDARRGQRHWISMDSLLWVT